MFVDPTSSKVTPPLRRKRRLGRGALSRERGCRRQFESYSKLRAFLGEDPVLCKFGIVTKVRGGKVTHRLIFQEGAYYFATAPGHCQKHTGNACLVSRGMFSTVEVLIQVYTDDPCIVAGGSQVVRNVFLCLFTLAWITLGCAAQQHCGLAQSSPSNLHQIASLTKSSETCSSTFRQRTVISHRDLTPSLVK